MYLVILFAFRSPYNQKMCTKYHTLLASLKGNKFSLHNGIINNFC